MATTETVLKADARKAYQVLSGNTALAQIRQAAFAQLESSDFPTAKHEEWKYTNVKNIVGKAFSTAQSSITAADIAAWSVGLPQGNLLVFVNGRYQAQWSKIVSAHLQVQTLQSANETLMQQHFGQYAPVANQPFVAMNTAFAGEGILVHIGKGKTVAEPVIMLFCQDATIADQISQPRNLFVAEENSEAAFLEHFVSKGTEAHTTNVVNEWYIARHARIEHCQTQQLHAEAAHINFTQVYQTGESYYTNTTLTLSGGIVRNNLHIALDGEHCEAYMNGLYAIDGNTHVDNHTLVDHRKPHSYSNELYKGLLSDRSTAVFNGKIFVQQDAQKTNAYQSNKNILLSETATVNTKPQLEIWADDVKCSHGCTIGALDTEPLFYLKARGISEDKAILLLVQAFAADVLDRVKNEAIRTFTQKLLADQLGQEEL